jgi:hypothetical protein
MLSTGLCTVCGYSQSWVDADVAQEIEGWILALFFSDRSFGDQSIDTF